MRKNITFYIMFFVFGLVIGYSFFLLFNPTVETVFSPEAEEEVLSFIRSAEESIDIEVYTFSSEEVAELLIQKHNEGVEVRVLMESRFSGGNNVEMYSLLREAGIDVKWASRSYKLTHSKFIIIDDKRVFVGSHNLSDSALEENREASVIIEGDVVKDFILAFEYDWAIGYT